MNALIEQIRTARPGPGEVNFWRLAQHSFVVRIGPKTVWLDPFLSDFPGRLFPSTIRPSEVTCADVILGSHDHADHIDRGAWPALAAACDAEFVVPALLKERLAAELKIPAHRLVGVDDGQTVEVKGVRVSGIAAAHEFLDQDPVTGRYPYLGYVVEVEGIRVYHAGDCCVYEGLVSRLKSHRPHVMLLPINGRDAQRLSSGCIGCMTFQEAVDLAGAVGPQVAVPAHYDLFEGNTEDPAKFMDYLRVKYPQIEGRLCPPGEKQVCRIKL